MASEVEHRVREVDRDVEEGKYTFGEFLEALAFYIKFAEEHPDG